MVNAVSRGQEPGERLQQSAVGGDVTLWRAAAELDLFTEFTTYLVRVMGRSPRTAESYCGAVQRAARFCDKPASKIKADDLVHMLLEAPWALSTKRGAIVAFRQFHLWGSASGHWKRNGIADLKTPKVPRRKLPPISRYEALRCLSAAHTPVEWRIVYLGLYGGLRVEEQSTIDEKLWGRDRLTFIGKGNKEREVPIHPELARMKHQILSAHPSKEVMESTMWRFSRTHSIKDTKGKHATTHSLRRTCGNELYARGTPWEVVKKALGHGEDVTALYPEIPFEKMEQAFWSINYDDSPVQLSFF